MARNGNRGRGKRSQFNRDAERTADQMTDIGSTSKVVAEGKGGKNSYSPAMYDCHAYADVEDRNEHGLLIPARKSLSLRQRLGSFRSEVLETIDLKEFKVNLKTGKRETVTDPTTGETADVYVSNPRPILWSDKTLLRRGKPEQLTVENSGTLKRQTSKTKQIVSFKEIEIVNPDDLGTSNQLGNSETPTDADSNDLNI